MGRAKAAVILAAAPAVPAVLSVAYTVYAYVSIARSYPTKGTTCPSQPQR